jgi:carbonic anhydrase/acetyltransferase-like protein (isoleucine patch superfamily)
MPIIDFEQFSPQIAQRLFLAPDAWVIGKTEIGDDVSIFFGAVLRGDINRVLVGSGSNIQEHSVLHTSQGLGDVVVGKDVTVGHRAILHGCKISDRCIIGMNSVLLDDAEIGEDSIVGAHSLVSMGKKFPARSLIFGSPAKFIRELSEQEVKSIKDSAARYREKGAWYRSKL